MDEIIFVVIGIPILWCIVLGALYILENIFQSEKDKTIGLIIWLLFVMVLGSCFHQYIY